MLLAFSGVCTSNIRRRFTTASFLNYLQHERHDLFRDQLVSEWVRRKANTYDFYSLRYVFAGGEAPASHAETMERAFGIRILEGYGTTEASPAWP